MTAQHSRRAPSSAARWVPCPGSVWLSGQFPDLAEDPAGPEGTAAHWVWHQQTLGAVVKLGDLAENGIAVTDEMLDGADLYIETLLAIGGEHWDRWRHEVTLLRPDIGPDEVGTPDSTLYLPSLHTLHLVDYKFGFAKVDPFENWQIADYAQAEIRRLVSCGALPAELVDSLRVVFTVVQPRCYRSKGPVSSWETTAGHLASNMWPQLIASAKESEKDDQARRCAGAHCDHCPGRRACPTLQRNAGRVSDLMDWSYPAPLPNDAAGLELSYLVRAQQLLEARISGLEAQIEHAIRSGERVPGWAMESSAGRLEWSQPLTDVLTLGDVLGVDLRKPEAPITPTQARALFKKKQIDGAVIDEYSARAPGSVKLQPINQNDIRKIFR